MSALPPSTAAAAPAASTAAASTARVDPAAALLSFAASSTSPAAAPASTSTDVQSKPPTGTLRVWQVEVVKMWTGCRIEAINVGTHLFLSRDAALNFAYSQALIFENEEKANRGAEYSSSFSRASDGNYRWANSSYEGWGDCINTKETALKFDGAPGAAIWSSFYSDS